MEQQTFLQFADKLPDGLMLLTSQGHIIAINRKASQVLDLKSDELIDRNLSVFTSNTEAEITNELKNCVRSRIPVPVAIKFKNKSCHITGGFLFTRATAESPAQVVLKIHEKPPLGSSFHMLKSELANQRKRTHQIMIAQQQAERSDKAKSEFLSAMSHELRTPLNSILGFSQLLASDTQQPLTKDQQDSLAYVINSGQHLLSLINDLLDLSRIESGKTDVTIANVDVKGLINDVYQMVCAQAQSQAISLEHNLPDDSLPFAIKADELKIKQVLLNFASNAVKYNSQPGKVILSAHKTDDHKIRIAVSDTGDGISEDAFNALFEPFNRLDKGSSSIQGTGIGLTICKQLVELMQGQIGAMNNPDKGMTFWVEFDQA